MCVWEGSCVQLKQKSILPVDISHDRTPTTATTRLEKEVGGFLEYPHPIQHTQSSAKVNGNTQHNIQLPRIVLGSEEWWWRCCKTVGRGKFCVMRLWNACEDCSYHHTLAWEDPSLWARVWCSHQPGGVKEGGGGAPDQSASVWTQRFYRRRQQWKKANQKWHKCGFKDKETKIYRSMQKGLETL